MTFLHDEVPADPDSPQAKLIRISAGLSAENLATEKNQKTDRPSKG
jgi:hypothetical protein